MGAVGTFLRGRMMNGQAKIALPVGPWVFEAVDSGGNCVLLDAKREEPVVVTLCGKEGKGAALATARLVASLPEAFAILKETRDQWIVERDQHGSPEAIVMIEYIDKVFEKAGVDL